MSNMNILHMVLAAEIGFCVALAVAVALEWRRYRQWKAMNRRLDSMKHILEG